MDTDALRAWHRIEAWPLSAPDRPLEFEARLAAEQGWTLGHAMAVVREYRRFLLLTQVQSGGAPPRPVEPVAPSADVDLAWHLHITRTGDYERFCFEALGRFLHHHPSRGGIDELARHRQMYARTLDVYRDVFDDEPDPALWPGVDERFAAAARREAAEPAVRADTVSRWLLFAGGLALAGALAMACSATGVLAPLRAIPGPAFAVAYLVMLVGLALVGLVPARPRVAAPARDIVEPYELAWLAGGPRRIAATAVVALVDAGRARLVAATARAQRTGRRGPASTQIVAEEAFAMDTPPAHPIERRILEAAQVQAIDFPAACRAIAGEAALVEVRLQDAGLARDRGLLDSRRLTAFAGSLLLLAVVFERLAHAIEVQRPVGFLVALLWIHLVLSAVLVLQRGRLTSRGRAILAHMRKMLPKPAGAAGGKASRPGPVAASPASDRAATVARPDASWLALPTMVALFGAPAVMADPRFSGIEHAIGREGLASSSGDSGSGGCSGGGGGDGGVGGGCGGCGGS